MAVEGIHGLQEEETVSHLAWVVIQLAGAETVNQPAKDLQEGHQLYYGHGRAVRIRTGEGHREEEMEDWTYSEACSEGSWGVPHRVVVARQACSVVGTAS